MCSKFDHMAAQPPLEIRWQGCSLGLVGCQAAILLVIMPVTLSIAAT